MSDELKKIIIDHVKGYPGIKGTALVACSLDTFYAMKKKGGVEDSSLDDARELPDLFNTMVQDGDLVEVEYVLSSMDYRIKSMYFPKGTVIRQQEGDPRITRCYLGEEAKKEYRRCLDAAFSDDSTGGVFAYSRSGPDKAPEVIQIHEFEEALAQGSTDLYEMIVIDSGDKFGNAWKFVFHPLTTSAAFFSEAPDVVLLR